MASSTSSLLFKLTAFTLCFWVLFGTTSGQLSANFYAKTCPNFRSVITRAVNSAVSSEARMGASLLRLHFHDCFVNGCDGSVLLDDNSTFTGEKTAGPNSGSIRGFNVIDTIKTQLESQCPGVVSCADILAAAARDAVVALSGPSWGAVFGRRDSTTASLSAANSNLPGPGSSLSGLISSFSNKGFTANEMIALSGSHSIGQARCTVFRNRLYNDNNINASFAATLQPNCPTSGGDNNLSPLDLASPTTFDNKYYNNLISQSGLLHSDQELFNGGSADAQVRTYASNQATFFRDFGNAMVKMGNLSPLTGSSGQVRTNCRKVN
ncbi:cationic peroxidase 1-like [Rutidosis leptorrhynchoides]|uniref:cationic peroxidase 1-like n=1 Tax=Rutidosis leptorrhynchoides TaxID=125765 RepID=UPI003A9A2195